MIPIFTVVTPRQGEVLVEIIRAVRSIVAELGQRLGVTNATIDRHLAALRVRGLVTWARRRARTLHVTGAPFVVVSR